MEHPEDAYCSTTDFKANLKSYKGLAETRVVHVTEHGHAGYVLTSLEVFERRKAEACHRARWQVWAEHACYRGYRSLEGLESDLQGMTVEYLGEPGSCRIARSFGEDLQNLELSLDLTAIVHNQLERLKDSPHAGLSFDVGPEAHLPAEIRPHRLNARDYDIIYGVDRAESVQVYGLIAAL